MTNENTETRANVGGAAVMDVAEEKREAAAAVTANTTPSDFEIKAQDVPEVFKKGRMEGPNAESTTHGTVRAVCMSKRKGTRKEVVNGPIHIVEQFGVEGDAHAGHWHRQVSLLAWESIEKARARGLDVKEGDFAENVTTEGINLLALPLGTQVRIGDDVLLELSQQGKVCHKRCAIYYLAGDCIFPREGVFFVVLKGGDVKAGDSIDVVKEGDGTCAFTPTEALEELANTPR